MVEENGFEHYSQRRHGDPHNPYAYGNGISGGIRESMEVIGGAGDDGAVHISHRISEINFTPTLHDSLVHEIRKLRNKVDKKESEVKSLNDELDHLREVHENLQDTHSSFASNSSKEIRSLRTQLERNAAVHVSEIKSLRSELHDTASVVHDLRQKLENARRAKSLSEEQRDKCLHDLEELKTQSSSTKADLERRLVRETERVKVLEELAEKLEAELERSNAKSSNRMSIVSSRMSLRSVREESEEEDDDEGKHEPGSPVQTLFAEMASMEQEDSDEEEQEEPGQFSSPQSPQSSVSLPSIAMSQVLQTLREQPEVITVDCGVQTERPHLVPLIRVLSPTPPLTNAPLMFAEEIETVECWTQTDIETISTGVQTDPQIRSPIISKSPQPSPRSPILRPQNSIRRGSHSVRWQEEKSIQTEAEERPTFAEIAIQTDAIVIAKILKPALKTPEPKEPKDEEKIRLGQVKSYDGPAKKDTGAIAKPGSTARVISTRRLESHRSSILFGNGMAPATHIHGYGHERKPSGSSSMQPNRSSVDLRRGRQPHPKGRSQPQPQRVAPDVRLHSPTGIHPPLPIPQRSSSKFRVVLPIVRDRDRLGHEESLPNVVEEMDPISEEERNRRELNAFLARPPRKTVRQIRSAVNLRSAASTETIPSTPSTQYLHHDPTAFTPSSPPAEMSQKSYSTPRKLPKRLVKIKGPYPVPEPTPVSSVSPASSYFPTHEEVHVVNEIAKCMIGEYMYKYVRKRRRGSFTWKRSPARQTQTGYMDEVEESTVRHKRWVYLQPYEKTILWSPTQPPSQNNFLHRAQLKKRIVTGVIDVKDDTPLMISPSSSHLASPVHNRSIVVLTPTQAIKFTALSRESHIAWLTALDFLVHNDPADLVIPRGISTSPSNGSLWPYAPSRTASSIASSQGPSLHGQLPPPPTMPAAYSYSVHKNASLSDYEGSSSRSHRKEDPSPLGYKFRHEDKYATPPLVPRIPTGRRFEGHGRSGSGSGHNMLRDWEETGWPGNGETIRMDAFVKRTPPKLELDIDHTLFREF